MKALSISHICWLSIYLFSADLFAQTTTVYTPKGTAVTATLRSEYTASQISQITQQTASQWPNATVVVNASNQYNCHTYAWHLTEGNTNKVWITTPEDDKYWNDGSFIRVCLEGDATKVSYASDDHSAVRSLQSAPLGRYDSKWGNLTVMRHAPDYTPYNSSNRHYYKGTKITGPATICSSTSDVVYTTAATAITGATYTWTKSSNILLNGSGSGILARAVAGASGPGWIEVLITTPCGTSATARINVQVGVYSSSQITVSGQVAVCPGGQYWYSASPTGTSYSWTFPSGWNVMSQSGNQIALSVPSSSPSGGAVRVSITNACGASTFSGITVFPMSCGGFLSNNENFVIYPNPTSDQLTVASIAENNRAVEVVSPQSNDGSNNFSVTLYNDVHQAVRTGSSLNGNIEIKTSGLPKGVYYLEINSKHGVETKRVIVN